MKAFVIKNEEGKYFSFFNNGKFENELNDKVYLIQDENYANDAKNGISRDFGIETTVQVVSVYEGDFSKTKNIVEKDKALCELKEQNELLYKYFAKQMYGIDYDKFIESGSLSAYIIQQAKESEKDE